MFLILEGIGCPPVASIEQPGLSPKKVPSFSAADITNLTYSLPELEFRMHSHVGITRPIFDIVSIINKILVSSQRPDESVINAIEAKLLQNDPELLDFQYPSEREEIVFRTLANLFFSATIIYFRRYIRGESALAVQNQVQIAVEQLQRAEELFAGSDNTNWLWPVLVIACEIIADNDTRLVVLEWFHRNERLGLRNITQARELVEMVWNRRDDVYGEDRDIAWVDVMKETNHKFLLI